MAHKQMDGQMNFLELSFQIEEQNLEETEIQSTCMEDACTDIGIVCEENEPEKDVDRKPESLKPGDTVYQVFRGEIAEYIVTEENWEIEDVRYYRLQAEQGSYSSTNDKKLGIDCFLSTEDAQQAASVYREGKDIIYAEDIEPISVEVYTYIRKCDSRKMTAFCADIGKYLYIKEFMTYHHLVENTPKNWKKFRQQKEFQYCDVKQELWISGMDDRFIPKFKNMYRCKDSYSDWLYAEAGYTPAVG